MVEYLYLNQISGYTEGCYEARHILHAAANGVIKLYAHTPEGFELASDISPISKNDCAVIEREYNSYCSLEKSGEFADCAFALFGYITDEMRQGERPFLYQLKESIFALPDSPRMQWESAEHGYEAYRVLFRVHGSDFIVFKADIDAMPYERPADESWAYQLADTSVAAPTRIEDGNSETALRRTQRTLAALAVGLAKDHPKYNYSGKPNASQIAKLATEHLRDATGDRSPHGFGETTARNTITEAVNSCPELTENPDKAD